MSAFDAFLGQLYADGVRLELRGALNFVGLSVTPGPGRWDVAFPTSPTFNGAITVSRALTTAFDVDGLTLQNTTPSTGGAPLHASPSLRFIGTVWNGAASVTELWGIQAGRDFAGTSGALWFFGSAAGSEVVFARLSHHATYGVAFELIESQSNDKCALFFGSGGQTGKIVGDDAATRVYSVNPTGSEHTIIPKGANSSVKHYRYIGTHAHTTGGAEAVVTFAVPLTNDSIVRVEAWAHTRLTTTTTGYGQKRQAIGYVNAGAFAMSDEDAIGNPLDVGASGYTVAIVEVGDTLELRVTAANGAQSTGELQVWITEVALSG